MQPELWQEWIKVAAFIGGLCVGTFAVASPAWVWLRLQQLPMAACWLATVGALLVSMSIWQSVQIEGPGFKAHIAELQKQTDELRGAVDDAMSSTDAFVAAFIGHSWNTQTIDVKKGEDLTSKLELAGIHGDLLADALRTLLGVYDAHDFKANRDFSFIAATQADHSAQLLSVALDPGTRNHVLIVWEAEGRANSESFESSPRRELIHREGEIRTTFYQPGEYQLAPSKVTDRIIRLFSWDVDFQRDLRSGDRFDTLIETITVENDSTQVKDELIYAGLELSDQRVDAYLYKPTGSNPAYYDRGGASLQKFLLRTPIDGAKLSANFGLQEHPEGYAIMHKGIDFAAPLGTPVYASGSGQVEVAGAKGAYGNYIRIRHSDIYSTTYAHLDRFAEGIEPGAQVTQGDIIGYLGKTGRVTGPALHYEVWKNGSPTDPMKIDDMPATQLSGADLQAFKKEVARIDAERAKLAYSRRIVLEDGTKMSL